MFRKIYFAFLLIVATSFNLLYSQVDGTPSDEIKKDTFWKFGGDIGLNFDQILFVNPRVGSGDNRIAFGGLVNFFGNYKKDKLAWSNSLKLQYAVQRVGENVNDNPFEKTIDNLRLGTAIGYKAFSDKTYWVFDATFESQLSKTYEGNLLKPTTSEEKLISNFMSPATINLALGLGYSPNENLTFFLSPAAFKTILVLDDSIAQLGVHGNEPIDRDDPSKGYKNSFNQFGGSFKALYNNKFAKDRILVSSELNLFSNYLFEPQNVDVYWNVDLGFVIWKNISINVVTNLYYDHDIFIPDDRNDPESGGGPRTTFTEALVIKYNYKF